jgi:hypothetical protein
VTGHQIYDTGSGLNLYRLADFKPSVLSHFPSDLTFNVYLLLWSLHRRQPIKFVPISWRETDQVSQAKVWRQGIKILGLLGQYGWSASSLFKKISMTPSLKPKFEILFDRV